MKLAGIFRFELAYQLRRPLPWLSLAVLIVFALVSTRVAIVPVTIPRDFILNSPFIIASVSVFSCQIWLLVAPPVAGEAAARDVHTGMHPLLYATPVSRTEYLGGRFLAALVLHAGILLGVQVGSLLAVYGPGANPDLVGPFRPAAYLAAYAFIALPNALVATTVQFGAALVSGRPMAAYVGSFGLFFLSYPVTVFLVLSRMARPEVALLTDPIGVFAIMNEMMSSWTLAEKNVRMFALEGHMLWNRLLWTGISLATLGLLHRRFRFAHRTAYDLPGRLLRRFSGAGPMPDTVGPAPVAVSVPRAHRSFGLAARLRQTLAIGASSFGTIATSPAGLFLLAVFPAMLVLILQVEMQQWGVPLRPRTVEIVTRHLTAPLTDPLNYWVMVPLLVIFFAGELLSRERDARLHESVDATPAPAWVLLLGKYLGLVLVLAASMATLTAAGVLAQALRGHRDFEIARYLQLLFGFQLPEYLLFAMLALAIQVVVNHRYVGELAALVTYLLMVFSGLLGIEHRLLLYVEGARRYFHYASDVPMVGLPVFFSAGYAVHRERWRGVDVQLFVHPAHATHRERVLRGVRASLDYYSEQFGPCPYPFLQVVEQPGNLFGMGVDGSGVVTGGEGFFLLDPAGDGFDAIFEIVAHEMGHQWWGMQLRPAFAEGAGVISEGLAWYSAMRLVRRAKGREALRRFMGHMREPNPWPPIRTGLPLLRALDPWAGYRKAPYALHALSEYVGEDRVNGALRSLLRRQSDSLATTLDLYRELQAATPDSMRSLLRDLFETNTFWTFETRRATAGRTAEGAWRVTLEVEARKVVADSAGVEREVPMGEPVEIGIFAPAGPGEALGRPLYVRKHRLRSGRQPITVVMPREPARAGIDPYNLLDWEEDDNIEGVEIQGPDGSARP